jgi:hypothetical protein
MINPDHTYCNVKGFVKKMNETAMLKAFLIVVTVTAVVDPELRTSVRTT